MRFIKAILASCLRFIIRIQKKLFSRRLINTCLPFLKLISFSGYVFFIIFGFNQTFAIKKIYLDFSSEVNGLNNAGYKNIFFFNTDDFAKQLASINPNLSDIKVEKQFPDALRIKFNLREPFAYIKADVGYFLIDKSAVILKKERQDPKEFFVITYYQPFSYLAYPVGKKIKNNEVEATLLFSDVILHNDIKIDSIDILSSNMIRLNIINKKSSSNKSFYILISADKDLRKTAYEFSYFWNRFTEKDRLEYIDLRFDKVIYKSF